MPDTVSYMHAAYFVAWLFLCGLLLYTHFAVKRVRSRMDALKKDVE